MFLTLILVGIVFFVGISWVILSFNKLSDRADREMRIICNEEFPNSGVDRQNLPNRSTKNKNSEVLPKPQSLSRRPIRSPLIDP